MMPSEATVGVIDQPLLGLRPQDMRPEPAGRTLADVAPITDKPVVCQVAGIAGYVPRAQWGYALQPGDIVIFTVDPPESDGALRGVVSIAAAIAVIYFSGGTATATLGSYFQAAAFGITVGNLLLPPSQQQAQAQQAAQNVFSTSLSGNQAKLDQPIWKVCGRRKITPPFVCEPYLEYLESENGLDNQQYYYALLAVGEGGHEVEQALIGGTPITHYADVLVSQYLAPGVQPSQALANVSNCTSVSGSVLESGKYVGGFAACRPQRTCAAIGIDIIATRGLGKGGAALTVSWRVETRTINDFGVATSAWSILGSGTKTAATNTPQRWSEKLALPAAARVEVRLVRTDPKDGDTTAAHEIVWAGLRAYLSEPAPLNPHTAHYEVVLRASDQLGQLAQRDIALIVTGKARTWTPGGGWDAEVATRNGMWWCLDLMTNANWGGGYPDARVDIQSFYALALTADARQDRFDWVFDSALTLWDAAQLIARSCRARVFRRNGVFTVARDELATLPVTAFTHRNCMPGSMVISEKLPTNDTPDGFVVEYEDNRTWLWTALDCPAPGVVTMVTPVRKRIEGITGATHAQREGMYEAANLTYRSRTTTCKTEMQGVLPAFMSPVRWLPEVFGYGQSGDVAFWDPATLVMGLTEPPAWGAADLYLTLQRDDGSLTAPVRVTPGPQANDVVLPAAPDFDLVLDDGARERPKYLLGAQVGGDETVKVLAIRDGGKGQNGEQLYDVDGVIDDVRVHAADNALLPGPGVVQDPIDSSIDAPGGGDTGAGNLLLVNINDRDFRFTGSSAQYVPMAYQLTNYGGLSLNSAGAVGYQGQPAEWMQFGSVETSVAALYEVMVTPLGATGTGYYQDVYRTPTGSATGVWLNLGTTREWSCPVAAPGGGYYDRIGSYVRFKVEIRLVGTTLVLNDATIQMVNAYNGASS